MDSQKFIDLQLLPLLVQQTTQLLEAASDQLSQIQWTDSEANTDSGFSKLACQKFEEAFHQSDCLNIRLLETKTPDIQIIFIDDQDSQFRKKIELKSCKNSKSRVAGIIPGSTISKLDLNTWVIFCRRSLNNSKFEFRYGRYYLGITLGETDLFQDRSPRPRLSWDKYQRTDEIPKVELIVKDKEWVKRYARAAINRIFRGSKSWQDDLVR
ncbi:MAG: hypothetical protein HC916_08125 [Coleofasciculaceae cyanobacterium SM2_1_6]|nr:hypothetical protein [Coleofasciculaceae cyanobacterium SM2_1_6]